VRLRETLDTVVAPRYRIVTGMERVRAAFLDLDDVNVGGELVVHLQRMISGGGYGVHIEVRHLPQRMDAASAFGPEA